MTDVADKFAFSYDREEGSTFSVINCLDKQNSLENLGGKCIAFILNV